MAELFWGYFGLNMEDVPDLVSFAVHQLSPAVIFMCFLTLFLCCTLLLCFYFIGLVGGLWYYFHNRNKPIRVYPPKGKR